MRSMMIIIDDLYVFSREGSKFTFTTCGATGANGPTMQQCFTHYQMKWVRNEEYFGMSRNGIQELKIYFSGIYHIKVSGAGTKIAGAIVSAKFKLRKGTTLYIAVGQTGQISLGGSGGTFVAVKKSEKFEPLIIAGGAGVSFSYKEFARGSTDESGNRSCTTKSQNIFSGHSGQSGCSKRYNGGGGFYGQIQTKKWDNYESLPKSFQSGMTGGQARNAQGGFGGGGHGPGGGGGGYTGGHGGLDTDSGGGGSFIEPHNSVEEKKLSIGHIGAGKCEIELLRFIGSELCMP